MLRNFFHYFGGMIIHPRAALDELGRESSVRYAVLLVILGLLLTLLNVILFKVFGFDWLGTRRELTNPTYIGFFGRLRLDTDHYVPIFNLLLNPLMSLVGLIFIPGLAQLLSKLWKGTGTFEQMVNTIVFAMGVPSILISSVLNDLFLGGVLPNLLTGHPYAFTAAQTGEFGPLVQTWWLGLHDRDLHSRQGPLDDCAGYAGHPPGTKNPGLGPGGVIMLFGYVLWYYGVAGIFVR